MPINWELPEDSSCRIEEVLIDASPPPPPGIRMCLANTDLLHSPEEGESLITSEDESFAGGDCLGEELAGEDCGLVDGTGDGALTVGYAGGRTDGVNICMFPMALGNASTGNSDKNDQETAVDELEECPFSSQPVKLVVGEQKDVLFINKAYLCRSQVFRDIFKREADSQAHVQIVIPMLDSHMFKFILQYLCTGDLPGSNNGYVFNFSLCCRLYTISTQLRLTILQDIVWSIIKDMDVEGQEYDDIFRGQKVVYDAGCADSRFQEETKAITKRCVETGKSLPVSLLLSLNPPRELLEDIITVALDWTELKLNTEKNPHIPGILEKAKVEVDRLNAVNVLSVNEIAGLNGKIVEVNKSLSTVQKKLQEAVEEADRHKTIAESWRDEAARAQHRYAKRLDNLEAEQAENRRLKAEIDGLTKRIEELQKYSARDGADSDLTFIASKGSGNWAKSSRFNNSNPNASACSGNTQDDKPVDPGGFMSALVSTDAKTDAMAEGDGSWSSSKFPSAPTYTSW